jgi:hypothetical protein
VAGALAGAGAAAAAVAGAAAVAEAGVVAGASAGAGAAAGVEAFGADVVDLNGTGSLLMHVVQLATCGVAPISSWPVNVQQPAATVVAPTS